MITWLEEKPTGPVEIVTPVGIAGIRGTTVFVNIQDDPEAPIEIFSWEGQVAFIPTGATEAVLLNSGEQLLLRPGEQDVIALRRQVRRLERREVLQRLGRSRLINGFSRPLPTRDRIQRILEEQNAPE
jgi:hypothetical protein